MEKDKKNENEKVRRKVRKKGINFGHQGKGAIGIAGGHNSTESRK